MKAMLLTAGVGQRMYPLTLSQPKPAIPVLGRPLVVQILHWLARMGVERAVLNLHHMPEAIQRVLRNGNQPGLPELRFTHEETILGTAGGIRNAGPSLCGDGPIVVSNADFLADIDLTAAMDAHLASDRLATLVVVPWRPGYSVVLRGRDGAILSLAGEPEADASRVEGEYLFTGCHIIDEELIERIPAESPSCIVRDVYRPLVSEGRLGSYVHNGFWWEFGSPKLYLEGCLHLLAESRDRMNRISTDHDPIRRVGEAIAAIGPGAEFDRDVQLVGRVAIGYGSYLSERAHVEDSVIMPEAWIGPRCSIRNSIIAQGVELPAEFRCEDQLICIDPDPTAEPGESTHRESGLWLHALPTPARR